MNHSAYLFGKFGFGYTQYPDDYAKDILKSIVTSNEVKTQIAIRRDGNLVYYIYVRRLYSKSDLNEYIGVAVSFNDLYCNDIKQMFSIFEGAIAELVVVGKILEFTDTGDVTAKATKLHQEHTEIDRIMQHISLSIDKISSSSFRKLPPLNYAAGADEFVLLPTTATAADINSNIKFFNLIHIYKNEDYDTQLLVGYSGKIKSLNKQIENLTNTNEKLSDELTKVRRQKKHTRVVTALVLMIVVVIIFVSICVNLSNRVNTLSTNVKGNEKIIEEKESIIKAQNSTIKYLENSLAVVKQELSNANMEIKNLDDKNLSLESQIASSTSHLNKSSSRPSASSIGSETHIPKYRAPYTVTSKEFTMYVGDQIMAKISDGAITKWEIQSYNRDYISANGNILRANKIGNVTIWGYVNNSPKLFTITIKSR